MNKEIGTVVEFNWVKRLGQGHYAGEGRTTLCGKPMLGNNYAGHIPIKYPCAKCIAIKDDIEIEKKEVEQYENRDQSDEI